MQIDKAHDLKSKCHQPTYDGFSGFQEQRSDKSYTGGHSRQSDGYRKTYVASAMQIGPPVASVNILT